MLYSIVNANLRVVSHTYSLRDYNILIFTKLNLVLRTQYPIRTYIIMLTLINLTSTISTTSIDEIQDISTCVASTDTIQKFIENTIDTVFYVGNYTFYIIEKLSLNTTNEIIVFILSLSTMLIGLLIGFYAKIIFDPYRQERTSINKTALNDRERNYMATNTTHRINSKPINVPKHIAVIMDGNRRFGREIHSDPLQGHWSGGQTLVDFIQWCKEDGVEIVTVYAFSTENWNRDQSEIHTLMSIFAKYAETFRKEALDHNVKVNILSTQVDKLPMNVRNAVYDLQQATSHCTSFIVNICLSYGSRGDIVNACQEICQKIQLDINEIQLSKHLCTRNLPDPDLLIRTSGEYRLSNFLLWQMAYTEMFFINKYWPLLTKSDYREILHQYAERKRRYGK